LPVEESADDLAVAAPFELCSFGFLLAWPSLAGLFALTMMFLDGIPSGDLISQHMESGGAHTLSD
jgi:hypothetical protein